MGTPTFFEASKIEVDKEGPSTVCRNHSLVVVAVFHDQDGAWPKISGRGRLAGPLRAHQQLVVALCRGRQEWGVSLSSLRALTPVPKANPDRLGRPACVYTWPPSPVND